MPSIGIGDLGMVEAVDISPAEHDPGRSNCASADGTSAVRSRPSKQVQQGKAGVDRAGFGRTERDPVDRDGSLGEGGSCDPGRWHASIVLVPTFSGCPALYYIKDDVRAAALTLPGIVTVDVDWDRSIAWGPERITEAGREALREGGIAPPGSGQVMLTLDGGTLPRSARPGVMNDGVQCPYCGSDNTRGDSVFGSAPCRSTLTCRSCKTPFDAIKAM